MKPLKLLFFLTLVPLFHVVPLAAAIPSGERDALVALFESTEGEAWTDSTGWLGASGSECSWYGVTCNEEGSTVIGVELWSNNLVGTIPPSIGTLSNLQDLALAANQLSGEIPPSIGALSKLRTLNLQENGLSGSIPSSIGNLVELEELFLFHNELNGSIPPSLGQLSKVTELALGGNSLTGPIPGELGNLSSVRYLELGALQLTGAIPASFGQLAALEWLSIESNELTGPIPPEIGNLWSLRVLDLQYNRISGSLPAQLAGLANIEELRLGGNELSGTIPLELMELSTLITLTLDSNQLEGTIPSSIGNLSNLEYLSLGFNELSGPVPPELGELTNLMFLDLPGNRLSGEIPAELANLDLLTYIDLSENQDDESSLGGLTGPVPPQFGALSNLRTLELSGNDLDGVIPEELGNLSQLESLGLADNRLSGTIPGSLSRLSNLDWLSLYGNHLQGAVPSWLGELPELTGVLLGGNALSGSIPSNITDLTNLESFDLCGNFITGVIPSGISNLTRLQYLTLCENDLSGPIPEGLWTLSELIEVRLEDNQLSGSLPSSIGNLANVEVLLLSDNQLEGAIPPELGELSSLAVLSLDGNRYDGPIPPQIGQLTQLTFLGLGQNALRGQVPAELMNLTNLESGGLRLGYNALFTNDPQLRNFIDALHDGEPFESSQTVPPVNVRVSEITDRSAVMSWSPITFIDGEGGYEVIAKPAGGGAETITTTPSKELSSTIVRGLRAEATYSVIVRSTTHPFGFQQNFLRSDPSAAVTFTTGPAVTAPASVGIVSLPGGLIQIGGVPQNSTLYTFANYGDVDTDIHLEQDGAFFAQSPASFTLAAGQTQVVTITSVSGQPPDSYWGTAFPVGDGVPEDLFATVQLLSVAAPSGRSIAEATTSRVELSGTIGSDSVATVTFRNVGTATLDGILVSDVDWIETPAERIEIPAGELRNLNFTVRRSKRPDAELGGGGTLFATIRLVYLDGGTAQSSSGIRLSSGTVSVSETLVTVVDTLKSSVVSSEIPPPGPDEIIRFIPGVIVGDGAATDVFLTNSFGSKALTDLRLFFKPSGSGTSAVAKPGSLAPSHSLVFASVVGSVFEEEAKVGSLLVRTDEPESVLLSAIRTEADKFRGHFSGAMPIFRSDRAAGSGDSLHLTGVRSDGSFSTTLFVQEVSGLGASATVHVYDAAGTQIGQSLRIDVTEAFAMIEQKGIPAGASSLVVSNDEGSEGRIAAWALVEDVTTGDSWAVIDWSGVYRFSQADSQRIPLVIREGGDPSRRRSVRRPSTGDSSSIALSGEVPHLSTSVSLFNPDTTDAVIRLTLLQSGVTRDRTITISPMQTLVMNDVVTFVSGGSGRWSGQLLLTPLSGRVATTARMQGSADGGGTLGTSVPVLASSSGLRLGQARLFAGVEDSTDATVVAAVGGTKRTSVGMAEVAGQSVTVRATLRGFSGRVLAATSASRDFNVGPGGLLLVEDVARSIMGSERDRLLGDMRNLQLELQVVAGEGAASVFLLTTDNGSNDPVLRLE